MQRRFSGTRRRDYISPSSHYSLLCYTFFFSLSHARAHAHTHTHGGISRRNRLETDRRRLHTARPPARAGVSRLLPELREMICILLSSRLRGRGETEDASSHCSDLSLGSLFSGRSETLKDERQKSERRFSARTRDIHFVYKSRLSPPPPLRSETRRVNSSLPMWPINVPYCVRQL